MRKVMVLLCILCLVFGMADVVRAQPASEPAIIFDADAAPPLVDGYDWFLGFMFHADTALNVTHLGMFMPDAINSGTNHLVAMFSGDGSYLGSTTVSYSGDIFGYTALASQINLAAGNDYYILGACEGERYVVGDGGHVDYNTNTIPYTTGTGITLISGVHFQNNPIPGPYIDGNDIDPNTNINLSHEFHTGPNFMYTAVPVPGAIWLLGSGLIGLVGLKRRRG